MQVIGLHSLGHDTGACLWEDGDLVYSIEAERLTRKRYEGSIDAAVRAIIEHPRFDLDSLGHIASSSHFKQRLLGIPDPENAYAALIEQQALHYTTTSDFCGRSIQCTIVSHEVSHAVLSLQAANWADGTLILVNEGRGIFSRNSLYLYENGALSLKDYNMLPWFGTGFGWSSVSYLVGLGRDPGVAGKAMAMSAFQPVGDVERNLLLSVRRDLADLSDADKEAVGLSVIASLGGRPDFDGKCRLVAALQELFVEVTVDTVLGAVDRYGAKSVALSGGCALNIIANSALRNRLQIPLHIPPACNDAGQALGAALYTQQFVLGTQPEEFSVYSTGEPITDSTTRAFLEKCCIASSEARPERVASLLADGKVVALAHGKSEVGPRALGNRSLLADPNTPGIKARVSEKLKRRESYRPLAPIMRAERFEQIMPGKPKSPAMLFNYDVTGKGFGDAAHVDQSARIQTVMRHENPLIHDILKEFEKLSSSPALINSSLNSGGRPICLSEPDVLNDFPFGTVDAYVLADRLVMGTVGGM